MSDRTMHVTETVVRIVNPSALWVDAFSVPLEEPARSICMGTMGAIYGGASHVVVVLSAECGVLLKQIDRGEDVDIESMLALERDDWVTRAWTYQEIVNSNDVRFVAEGTDEISAGAEQVLNRVGYALHSYKKKEGIDGLAMRRLHPRLDSLEGLILDWKMDTYLDRSAYQVISEMAQREAQDPEEHFYAMAGAVNTSPTAVASPTSHPAEFFMQACEAKGDFSFLYSTAPRSEVPGRRWRPACADRFRPVFPLHSYGAGQPGHLHATHIELEGMWCSHPGVMTPAAKEFAATWLVHDGAGQSSEAAAPRALRRLRKGGFTGCGEHLEVEGGIFFPQEPLP